MAGNFFSNLVSDIGRNINAPVIFDWDTNAAREDLNNRATNDQGNIKRGGQSGAAANQQLEQDAYWLNRQAQTIPMGSVNSQNDSPITSNPQYTGGSTGSRGTASTYNPQDIAYLDDQMARLRSQHGSADTALNNGLTQLQDSYGREVQGANTRQNQTMQDFTTKETDTTRAKDSALTRTNENARTLAEGLRRRLGLASGSGSSAFQFAAPGAVAKMATENRTGVLENFGANFRDLNTSRDRVKSQYEEMLADLESQRKTRESDFRSGILEKKSQIDGSLAEAARQKALALGGGYEQVKTAMSPFVSQIDSRQAEIDGLFNKFRTPFTQKAVDTSMPTLRDYMVDRANIGAGQPGPQDPTAPYKNPFGIKEDDEKQVALY